LLSRGFWGGGLDGLVGLRVFLLLVGFRACGSSLCIQPMYLRAHYAFSIKFSLLIKTILCEQLGDTSTKALRKNCFYQIFVVIWT
jgi:hypothetical protein